MRAALREHNDAGTKHDRHGRVQWPSEITGSVSHCQSTTVVLIAAKTDAQGVGVDLEAITQLDEHTLAGFITSTDRRMMEPLRNYTPEAAATIVFSAKEAAFKAFADPQPRRLYEIAINVSGGADKGAFSARAPDGQVAQGKWWQLGGHILSVAVR